MTMLPLAPRVSLVGFALLGLAAMAAASAAEPPQSEKEDFTLSSLLPLAWQKRPQVSFNAITEMTAAGKAKRVPTSENPMYYVTAPSRFKQLGWSVAAGEKPPPVEEIDALMRKALAENGYLPTTDERPRPDVLIVFEFGSHGTDPVAILPEIPIPPPVGSSELVRLVVSDVSLFKDIIDRAVMVGGGKFALELKAALDEEVRNLWTNKSLERSGAIPMPVSPDFSSPFQIFIRGGNADLVAHLSEVVFNTCYFVVATAYDFEGVEKKEKIVLWQTRMTVEARGVSMREVMKPLVQNTAYYLGRDMPEAAMVRKRIDREGTVTIGEAEVVKEPEIKAADAPANDANGRE